MSFNTSISLSASVRSNLYALALTSQLTDQTTTRLGSGLKVQTVIDNAVAYFQSQSLNQRASDFANAKSSIDQGISSLTAALNASDAIDSLLKQMVGITQAAASQSTAQQVMSTGQFYELGRQISKLINDASYQGLNLLNSTASILTVKFSSKTNSSFSRVGYALNYTGTSSSLALFTRVGSAMFAAQATTFNGQFILGGTALGAGGTLRGFSSFATSTAANSSRFQLTVNALDQAVNRLRGISSALGSNVALLQTRLTFTTLYINTLQGGAGKLTLADLNGEGANLVSLQTRQQLGVQALSFAAQQQQAILRLFG